MSANRRLICRAVAPPPEIRKRFMNKKIYTKLVSLILTAAMLTMAVACDTGDSPEGDPPWLNPAPLDPNGDIIYEDLLVEETIKEIIRSEIYLKELVSTENEVTSLLLEDAMIDDVYLCKTIYVPEDNIEEFAENSGTAELFGEGVDVCAMAEQVTTGHGIIVTLVVLKRSGIPMPLASLVISHATEDVELDSTEEGAGGSLLGSIIGSDVNVEDVEKTAAMLIFAKSTVSLVISIVSLITLVPSGGASAVGVVAGVKIGFSAVSMVSSAVSVFNAVNAADVDWNNVDWDEIGLSGAKQAVNDSGDGYVWGSVAGPVLGGEEGYEDYLKFSAPYSSLEDRLTSIPADTGAIGVWNGERGESEFLLHEPITLNDGTLIGRITYKNAVPDFSDYEHARVGVTGMTDDRAANVKKADEALAEIWSEEKHGGRNWSAEDVAVYREIGDLVWHEMNNMEFMQLIPSPLGETFTSLNGCGEYGAMIDAFSGIKPK